jgi:hypothetical protein
VGFPNDKVLWLPRSFKGNRAVLASGDILTNLAFSDVRAVPVQMTLGWSPIRPQHFRSCPQSFQANVGLVF